MATKKVKKIAVVANDVAGLKSSRYEKLQVSYGYIPAGTISTGDVLSFTDVPSADILRATLVAHETTPVVLEVFPGSDVSSQLSMDLLQSSGSVACIISYVIEYVRGTGKVGVSASSAPALLNNADQDGVTPLKVASGDCLQVLIKT
jgi:hypothetical protein